MSCAVSTRDGVVAAGAPTAGLLLPTRRRLPLAGGRTRRTSARRAALGHCCLSPLLWRQQPIPLGKVAGSLPWNGRHHEPRGEPLQPPAQQSAGCVGSRRRCWLPGAPTAAPPDRTHPRDSRRVKGGSAFALPRLLLCGLGCRRIRSPGAQLALLRLHAAALRPAAAEGAGQASGNLCGQRGNASGAATAACARQGQPGLPGGAACDAA